MALKMIVKLSVVALLLRLSPTSAISSLLLSSGPPCLVTTMITSAPHQTSPVMKGTCYSGLSCRQFGGVPIGRCGASNVCCVFPRTCEGVAVHNTTYFTNPGYPASFNGTVSCALTVHRAPGVHKICQLRLDFIDFELTRPNQGNCENDRLVVSGQNANSVVPAICGFNSGQHIYVDVDGAQGPFTLRIITNGMGQRRWNILISQIECLNPSKAPSNCLQYHLGPSGQISSFNYDIGSQLDPMNPIDPTNSQTGIGYLNSLDYTICFRKESGFCSQTYFIPSANMTQQFSNANSGVFHIVNVDDSGRPTVGANEAGTGLGRCPTDYLLMNGLRLCGNKLNGNSFNSARQFDAPVTDNSSGPFMVRFVSNDIINGRGFRVSFQQNPCGVQPQSAAPLSVAGGLGAGRSLIIEDPDPVFAVPSTKRPGDSMMSVHLPNIPKQFGN